MKSVLMHIQWRESGGYHAFRLNKKCYSAMPHEKEVLLQDGAKFKIVDVTDNYQVTDKSGN